GRAVRPAGGQGALLHQSPVGAPAGVRADRARARLRRAPRALGSARRPAGCLLLERGDERRAPLQRLPRIVKRLVGTEDLVERESSGCKLGVVTVAEAQLELGLEDLVEHIAMLTPARELVGAAEPACRRSRTQPSRLLGVLKQPRLDAVEGHEEDELGERLVGVHRPAGLRALATPSSSGWRVLEDDPNRVSDHRLELAEVL